MKELTELLIRRLRRFTQIKYLTRKDAKALLKENRPHIVRIKYLTQRRFSETEALSREACSLPMNMEITESDFL